MELPDLKRAGGLDKGKTTGHSVPLDKRSNYDAILEAGLEAFYQRGFYFTGVQEIVSRAGVPKGSFYNHFESKEALGLAVLDLYWKRGEKARAILQDTVLPVLKRIERHFAAFGFHQEGCLVGNFTAELSGEDKFRDRIRELWRIWTGLIAACLSEGQADGSVRSDIPAKELARFALTQWEGAVLLSRAERSAAVLAGTRKLLIEFLKS